MMDRRTFLAGSSAMLLAVPLAAEGQQAGKAWRIGVLAATPSPYLEVFRHDLRDLGWIEGQNITIEYLDGGGRIERLPDLVGTWTLS